MVSDVDEEEVPKVRAMAAVAGRTFLSLRDAARAVAVVAGTLTSAYMGTVFAGKFCPYKQKNLKSEIF